MRDSTKILASALLAASFVAPAFAADSPTKVRQDVMKAVGKATKAGGSMLKGETEFDAAVAQETLNSLHLAAVEFSDLFPVGSETGDETEASPKIWEDAAGWEAKLAKFEADTKAAADSAPADVDAFKAAFGQVAGNCKACHEGYRVKKD